MTECSSRQRFLYGLVAAVFFALILLRGPFTQSLWLDETVSWWVIKDSFAELWERTLAFQGQSPFYFILLKVFSEVFGSGEWVLRLPALFFGLASLLLTFKIARRYMPIEGAWISVLFLISINEIQTALFSARPYSLALMSALLSLYALMRWLESASIRWMLIYGISSLSAFYAHYLFGAMFLAQVLYFAIKPDGQSSVKWSHFFAVACFWLLLCIPGLLQLSRLAALAGAFSFAPYPSAQRMLDTLFPYRLIVCGALAFVCSALFCGFSVVRLTAVRYRAVVFFSICWLLPPALFALYAWSGGNSLFMRRYFLWHAPALVIVFSAWSCLLTSSRARAIFFVVCAILLLRVELSRRWVIEDWKGAVALINQGLRENPQPVLLNSGLVELGSPGWLSSRAGNEQTADYLRAPVSYYKLRTKPVLFNPNEASVSVANGEASISRLLVENQKLLLLSNKTVLELGGRRVLFSSMLIEVLRSRGFTAQPLGDFGAVGVWQATADAR